MDTEATPDATGPDPPGGKGGANGFDLVKDLRLAERAIAECWDVPANIRGPIVKRLAVIALDKGSTAREVTSAARALLAASGHNLAAIGAAIQAQQNEELAEKLDRLEAEMEAMRSGRRGGSLRLSWGDEPDVPRIEPRREDTRSGRKAVVIREDREETP
jgi:hypothetical protein